MDKIIKNKFRLLIVAITLFLTLSTAYFSFFGGSEKAFAETSLINLSIDSVDVIIEGDEGINGLRFTMRAPESEYKALVSLVGTGKTYESMETGIIIAPSYYDDTIKLDKDSLFGEERSYDWAEYVDGEYKYTGDKIRVVNINANYWGYTTGYYTYKGAIVDILPENETELFCAIGYVKVTDSLGNESYSFTQTIKAGLISTALNSISEGKLTDDQKTWVENNWLDGDFATAHDETVLINVDGLADKSYPLSKLIGDVAPGKKIIDGFFDYKNVSFRLTDPNGNEKTISFADGMIDLSREDNLRIWTVDVVCSDVAVYSIKVDFYSLVGKFVWNDENTANSIQEVDFPSVDGVKTRRFRPQRGVDSVVNDVNVVSYSNWSGNNGSWFFWKPLHSKEYYENFVGKEISISITISADGTNRTDTSKHVLNQGFIWGEGKYLVNVVETSTLTSKITLDEIVTNWDSIIDFTWDGAWGSRQSYAMVYMYNLFNGGIFSISDLRIDINLPETVVSGEELLVDLYTCADVKAVNVAELINEDALELINYYAQFDATYELVGINVARELAVTDLTSVNFSTATSGMYNLTIKSFGQTIYTAIVDVYTSATSPTWTPQMSANTVKAGRVETSSLGWSEKEITDLVLGEGYEIISAKTITDTTHPLYGKTGKFVKISSLTASEQLTFSIAPFHTKTYYAKHFGLKDYVLSFNVYFTGSFLGMSSMGAYKNCDNRFSNYSTWRGSAPESGKWFTYSIPFDSYLIPTDGSQSFSGTYLDFNELGTKVHSRNTMFQFEARSVGATVYIGLPFVETMPDFIHYSSTERTVDEGGYDVYNLVDLFTESERAKYDYYVTKYGFDKIFYKVTFADNTGITLWANEDGSINLDTRAVVETTDMGASITIADKLELGAISIVGKLCDVSGRFGGHTNVGEFGVASGCNNNQTIVKTGKITFINLPVYNEVYEIAVGDATIKVLKEDFSTNKVSDVYNEGNLRAVYENSVLNASNPLKINAFKNETEAAQIQIVAKSDVSEYWLFTNDLYSGSNVLSKDNFEIYHLLYTMVVNNSAGELNPTGRGMYPDAILPMDVAHVNKVAKLEAGKNQGIWVSLNVPGDQPAGVYTGTFKIRIGMSEYDIPVSITVYDYAVDEETHMITSIGLSYTNIKNLELPYEYDEEGNMIVNSSGNKTGTLSQEIVDAYVKYWTDHRLSTSPVIPSSNFSGAWQGYPYDPKALFSFEEITVNKKTYYAYQYPLRNKDADGNTYISDHVDNRTGHVTTGYPLYLDNVNNFFDAMVELAQNKGVTRYNIPVGQAPATNFNNDNINSLFTNWRGNLFEIREDMPDGEKAHVINKLVLRDVMEMFFTKAMELHKSGKSVDVFKKASLYPTWIDEFGINASKTHNAQYLLAGMKGFFPDLADWLAKVYEDEIGNDEFILEMLDSIRDIRIGVTTNTLEYVDPSIHDAEFIAVLSQYNSEAGRTEVDNWVNTVYEGNGRKWVYTAGNSYPQTSNNIDNTLIATRMIGWMMSEYDIEGYLYWASMNSKYMDGIIASSIKDVVGETVKDGDIIKLDDFYNNAIHYGGVAGDGFLIYPGAYYNVTGPVGTIRLEALTDSIEDYNLFYDLKAMYVNAGLEDSFYNVMRRLTEMLYTGTNCKVPSGYTLDFMASRASLANMLILARDYKIYADNVYSEGGKWLFSVVAPSNLVSDIKSGVNATFVSQSYVNLGGVSGAKMVFEVSSEMIESGYVTIPYGEHEINLSVETIIETKEVEALKWADVSETATTTVHNTYYSNGAKNTGANVDVVTLSKDNVVGGRTEGKYFFVSPLKTSDTSNLGFSLLPTGIDLETVRNYVGKAMLKFDVYMITTNIEDGSERDTWKVWYKLGKSTNSQSDTREWFTVAIDFAQIEANWDTLMDTSAKTYSDNWSTSKRALFAVNGASHSASGVHTTSYYIGNFRIEHA